MVLCGLGDSFYIKNDWCGSDDFGWVGEPIYMGGIPAVLSESGNHFDKDVVVFVQMRRRGPDELMPCIMFLWE